MQHFLDFPITPLTFDLNAQYSYVPGKGGVMLLLRCYRYESTLWGGGIEIRITAQHDPVILFLRY